MSLAKVERPSDGSPGSAPLLVLLHGLAADENDLMGLAPDLDPRLHVVSLRAPFETGYGGYAWFRIQFLPDGSKLLDEAQALESLSLLIGRLDALLMELSPPMFILGGFSQGAMMAAGVLLRRPEAVDAVWILSGLLLPTFDVGEKAGAKRPVLVQHGLYDEVVPPEGGRALAAVLRNRGHEVRFEEYAMGHQIGYESLEDATGWMGSILEGRH